MYRGFNRIQKYWCSNEKAEENHDKTYVFGFEESYGCLIGDYARDKDGIAAVMSLCEAAAYYRAQGITLWDQMNNIYKKYGYYKEDQVSIVLEGAEGAEKIKQMMSAMRNKNIEQIGKYKVLCFKDVDRDYVKNMITGEESKTGLPKSNVLYYQLKIIHGVVFVHQVLNLKLNFILVLKVLRQKMQQKN